MDKDNVHTSVHQAFIQTINGVNYISTGMLNAANQVASPRERADSCCQVVSSFTGQEKEPHMGPAVLAELLRIERAKAVYEKVFKEITSGDSLDQDQFESWKAQLLASSPRLWYHRLGYFDRHFEAKDTMTEQEFSMVLL